jgi:UDP-N-acetylglucosamine acyltransferase
VARVHALALVDPAAELHDSVVVGPFCIVEAGAVIGADSVLESHAKVCKNTTVGERNVIMQGAVIGERPQDKKFHDEPSYLVVGNDNTFREYVTVHRATGEGKTTRVGNGNYLMAYSHVGHNATIHNHVTMANGVALGGHVVVEDFVNIGGLSAVHQKARVGKVAMIGGMSRIARDVPPFMITNGADPEVHDINAVGLRRYGITPQSRMALHKACKLLYKSQLGLGNAIEIVLREVPITEEIEYLIQFERDRSLGKNGRANDR